MNVPRQHRLPSPNDEPTLTPSKKMGDRMLSWSRTVMKSMSMLISKRDALACSRVTQFMLSFHAGFMRHNLGILAPKTAPVLERVVRESFQCQIGVLEGVIQATLWVQSVYPVRNTREQRSTTCHKLVTWCPVSCRLT